MGRHRLATLVTLGCVTLLAATVLTAGGASARTAAASCPGLGNQTSFNRPAVAVFNGRLYMAWTGTNGNGWGNLNFISTDGNCFSSKTVSPQTSIAGPALAVYNGKLWAAYVAVNAAHNLALMSSSDGVHWSNPTVFTRESSGASLAMTGFNGALFLAWTGTDHAGYGHLFMLDTTDGVNYYKQEFASDTAPALDGPGLASFTPGTGGGSLLELAWTGTNNPSTIWAFQSHDGITWINHTNTGVAGIEPGISTDIGCCLAAVDRDFNGVLELYRSGDGRDWGPNLQEFSSYTSAGLALFQNMVWMGYTYLSSQSYYQLGLSIVIYS